MKQYSQRRTPSRLSDSVQHQLNMYALAASAAGVSAVALACPAEGKIIYTKTDVNVFNGYALDLNHDGTADFYIYGFGPSTTWSCQGSVFSGMLTKYYGAMRSNVILTNRLYPKQRRLAAAIPAGVRVGRSETSFSSVGLMGLISQNGCNERYYYKGWWENGGKGVKNRYLGLRFYISGKPHYGWARLNFPRHPPGATLTGYAYETIPNKPIIAGKTKGPDVITVQPATPGTLGRLALGRK